MFSDPCLVDFIFAQRVLEDLLPFCKDVLQDCTTTPKISFARSLGGEAEACEPHGVDIVAVPPLELPELAKRQGWHLGRGMQAQ